MSKADSVGAALKHFRGAAARARGPSKPLVLRLENRQPDLDALQKLTSRQVRLLSIRTFLTALYFERNGDSGRRTWQRRINALLESKAVVLLGPLEELLEKETKENSRPSPRQLQLFLCNITNLISPGRNNFIFFTKRDPRRMDFAVDTLAVKFRVAKIFGTELDVADEIWSDQKMETRDASNISSALSSELRAMVTSALKATHIKAESNDREALTDELTRSISMILSQKMTELLSKLNVTDPESGLSVPPSPRINYADRRGDYASLNAPQFLERVWGDYLDFGLLYTGHLKKVDSSLYNAIIYLARQTARGKAEFTGRTWTTELTHEILYEKYRLITETQLERPPEKHEGAISLIKRSIAIGKQSPREKIASDIVGLMREQQE